MLTLSASQVKAEVVKNEGKAITTQEGTTSLASIKQSILNDMASSVQQLDSLRAGGDNRRPIDLGFAEFVQEKWGFSPSDSGSPDSFYATLGIDPGRHTLESLMTMPEFPTGYRWIAPEVIREAIRLGLRKNPIHPALIAAEENVPQPTVIMPFINKSDSTVRKVGEAETIPVGSVSFGQKSVKIEKSAVGLKITDEVRQYVPLNILSIYLQDVGVNLNLALDTLAIETLINGDQANGSGAITQIGVADTANGITYDKDLLRAWIRMGRLGKLPSGILSNEDAALDILALQEFKGYNGLVQKAKLEMETPIPASQKYWIHGAMPSGKKIMLLDSSSALIKLNASALRVESERIAERQITGTYVSVVTGFATLFDDARLLIDGASTITSKPYPAQFNAGLAEQVKIK